LKNRKSVPVSRIRSAGITDLRHGTLLDDEWHGRDRFGHDGAPRRPVPLPDDVECYAIAATRGKSAGDHRFLGDGLVPLDSALGRHRDPAFALAFPATHQRIIYDASHLDLLSHPAVYEQIRNWLAD